MEGPRKCLIKLKTSALVPLKYDESHNTKSFEIKCIISRNKHFSLSIHLLFCIPGDP